MRTLSLAVWMLVVLFALPHLQAASGDSPVKVSPEARAIHNSAIIVDTHADTTQRLLDENFDLATVTPVSDGHVDFQKIHDGNLAAEFFSIWVDPDKIPKERYAHRTLQLIDSVYQQAEKHPDKMMMAFSVDDIKKARSAGKFAALMGIEGGHSIENDLGLLRNFYRLGVRYMTLTWSNTNEWADSSGDDGKKDIQHHDGLTDFGRQVVREMNHLGMMVDISHVSDKTFWDTMAITKAPVIASHSSARALDQHPRNMTDDMLKAVNKNGGVVMVNYFSAFIDENFRKAYAAQKDERDAAIKAIKEKYKDADIATRYRVLDRAEKEWANKIPRPPFRLLIDHIDHIAKVAGIDHVGLGSDFDGVSSLPQEIDSTADLPKITQALRERGYNREQIHKILGGNILRVFAEVERVSRESNR